MEKADTPRDNVTEDMTEGGEQSTLLLPSDCGEKGVDALVTQLRGRDSAPLRVDGSAVTHFDWPVAQLLIAFTRDAGGANLHLSALSERMAEDIARLGLSGHAPFSRNAALETAS